MKYFLFIYFYLCSTSVFSQKNIFLDIDSSEQSILQNLKVSLPKNNLFNSISELIKVKSDLVNNGYIFCSIDSVNTIDSVFITKLFLGEKIQKIVLFNPLNKTRRNVQDLSSIKDEILYIQEKYNDSGYFNIQVSLDSCAYNSTQFICNLNVVKGKKYSLDSILFESKSNEINLSFIKDIFNLHAPFNSISDIERCIKSINFIELIESPLVKIVDSSAIVYLKLKEQKLNQFNAFMGILPNSYNTNQLTITGDVSLFINNLFRRAIELKINWQKPQASSQFLYTSFIIPYVFKTPFGASFSFNLEKFDTSYIRLMYEVGLNYKLSYFQTFSLYYKNQFSTVLTDDTSFIFTNKLPLNNDYVQNHIGLQYKWTKTDRLIFPRNGFNFNLSTSIGIKKILKNQNIESTLDKNGVSYSRLYDSISLSTTIFYLALNLEKYILLSRNFTYKSSINSKMLFSPNISNNEMYTFGGYRLPRGFDDNIFLAPYYITFSNEIQYFLSSLFFTSLFVDITNYKNILASTFSTNTPIGFGAGISLKTKGGYTSISLAYGKMDQQEIQFKNAKIHFGYVSTF